MYKNVNYNFIKSTLNKLKSHSINYTEWLIIGFCLKDLYLGSTQENQEKIYNLFDDFSKSKNAKLKNLVLKVKKISDELVENYVETEFKESYLKSHLRTAKNIDRDEMKNIKFMKNFR